MHLEDDDVRRFATEEFNLPIEEREQFDMDGKAQQKNCSCIERLLHDQLFKYVGKQSEEDDGEEDDDSVEEDQQHEEDKVEEEVEEEEQEEEDDEEETQDPEMQR
jgi:hypothetical protein